MRKSREDAAATRRRIVEVAAHQFWRNGIHATRISDVMAAAGLTHGAFYRHFDSKDQLIAEAFAESIGDLVYATDTAVLGGDEEFARYAESFLSREFHEDFATACPLVTMGSEIARADGATRLAASQGLRDLIGVLARQDGSADPEIADANAMFKASSMVGAATLARLVDDEQLAERILKAARRGLESGRGGSSTEEKASVPHAGIG